MIFVSFFIRIYVILIIKVAYYYNSAVFNKIKDEYRKDVYLRRITINFNNLHSLTVLRRDVSGLK